MNKTPLEEFLDITQLKNPQNYVSNLIKNVNSKNITIDDWNTFVRQFQDLISQDAATYLGFNKVLEELQSHVSLINLINKDLNHINDVTNTKLDKLTPDNGYTWIYAAKPNGTQGHHSLTASNVRGTVMFRDSETGRSKINTPDEYDDIANKEYVDSREVAVREDMSAMDNRLSNDFASRIEMAEQTLNGNIEDTKRELSANIDEVESVAKGATQAESFFDYEEMVEKLNVAPRDTYRIGQSLFINTRNVPDLWIYNKGISSTTYNYSTDEVFVNELKRKGYVKVGYFTLSALETQKVDLTDYPTTEEVASIVKSVTYDKNEIDQKVTEKSLSFSNGDTVTVQNNAFYRADSEISSLNIVYPNGDFSCAFSFTLASSGNITITLPESKYIGGIPSFNNGETWELNIKNGVVVGGLVE